MTDLTERLQKWAGGLAMNYRTGVVTLALEVIP